MAFICTVILDIPYMTGWSYLHNQRLDIGALVSVPVVNKIHVGVVIDCTEYVPHTENNINANFNDNKLNEFENNSSNLKLILQVSNIIMPKLWLNMVYFIANYYHEGIGEVALNFIPKYIKNYRLWDKSTLLKSYNKFLDKFQNIENNEGLNTNSVVLNDEQKNVLDNILKEKSNYNVHVLHGVTGSGKTEIYLNLIQHCLESNNYQNTQILILVPEINLTPQIIKTVQNRFLHIPIVILNSDISEKQRSLNWYLAYTGFAKIIIGTRLASVAILPYLKLIIVDEEHDQSYKQQSGIRYNARDISIWQAKKLNIPIILGSATPSLETYNSAINGRYKYHTLLKRATDMVVPKINIIDRANYLQNQMADSILTPPLIKAMHATLENKHQVLLFLNRRGFAPVMFCANCRYTFACKNCSVNLVFHKTTNLLNCHHCGYKEKLANACPTCNHTQILPIGSGTQRLFQVLEKEFSNYKSLRIDSDSTSHKGELEAQLNAINNKEVDIIIGTQMLAKGHDFKHVAMVGIIEPDGMLYSYNFRSTEYLFCQLMQVIGRAGRHINNSHIFIQTMFPQHRLFDALKKHSYADYANALLKERTELRIMPFAFEVHIYTSHITPNKAKQELDALYTCILPKSKIFDCLVTPPNHHTMLKQNGEERAYIIIENHSRKSLHTFIDEIMPYIKSMRCSWYIDVL